MCKGEARVPVTVGGVFLRCLQWVGIHPVLMLMARGILSLGMVLPDRSIARVLLSPPFSSSGFEFLIAFMLILQ